MEDGEREEYGCACTCVEEEEEEEEEEDGWRGRQTRPTVSVQFPRHLKMNFSLGSLCSALTR